MMTVVVVLLVRAIWLRLVFIDYSFLLLARAGSSIEAATWPARRLVPRVQPVYFRFNISSIKSF